MVLSLIPLKFLPCHMFRDYVCIFFRLLMALSLFLPPPILLINYICSPNPGDWADIPCTVSGASCMI
ncbi:hypothetical protein BO78DRAFT_121250 [Aspergillus sclerotiicarbonarius CBS 121057]|uniref:Uncharacterized protein n=1 Tax=Aspergillus sclerotiicarbonarius (strain CBS 121057 / IBT 28362) TaxID=1448318 RepID=A0A319E841_ASPSB|nr:hypothetical protein BO78DRAFT_121250 [Aspergillus sclerotiicarbonarius CBS 121057]